MSVDRTLIGTAPAGARHARATALTAHSRLATSSRAAAGRDSREPTPGGQLVELEAIDPAITVELAPETVAALVAESAGAAAGAPAPGAPAAPWDLPTRPRRLTATIASSPIPTAAGTTLIWRGSHRRPHAPPRCHHRGVLAAALLWGVLATCLLIAACYVLSVATRTGPHGL